MKKYEVPTMNISKFEVENVLTLSGVNSADLAGQDLIALEVKGGIQKTTASDWNQIF